MEPTGTSVNTIDSQTFSAHAVPVSETRATTAGSPVGGSQASFLRRHRRSMSRVALIATAMLWLWIVALSWAEAAEAAEASEGDADRAPAGDRAPASERDPEYSFNWLDPDKKIYVLQNRRYEKAGRLLLSGMGTIGVSNPYRSSYSLDPRIAYYFTEWLGIEAFYSMTFNSENNVFSALLQTATLPVIREVRGRYGLLAHYVPWYAKINVFNSILYFDWYFSGGAGQLVSAVDTRTSSTQASNFVNQNLFAFYLGTGHQYHLSRWLTVRLDFTGAFYRTTLTRTNEQSWFSDYQFGLGLGVRL